MPVYVDDMYLAPMGEFGRMKMCHMIADTREELDSMADKIGVARKWIQYPTNPHKIHYDIAMSKRALAVKYGAVPITWRDTGVMSIVHRATGRLLPPAEAQVVLDDLRMPNRDLFY